MIARSRANLDDAFAALAHPVRRRIVEAATRKGRGVTELTQQFYISLATLSWALTPTNCNYTPIRGNGLNYRIRFDR